MRQRKETKRGLSESIGRHAGVDEQSVKKRKRAPKKDSELVQIPKKVGYHGTDDEKHLSPEE